MNAGRNKSSSNIPLDWIPLDLLTFETLKIGSIRFGSKLSLTLNFLFSYTVALVL